MKEYALLILLLTSCSVKCAPILLYKTYDDKPKYLLISDVLGADNRDVNRAIFVADAIRLSPIKGGTEIVFSNVVEYVSVFAMDDHKTLDSTVHQSAMHCLELKVHFLLGTQLLFRSRLVALDKVKNEDLAK
jgi:hypothetical protein